MDRVKKHRCPRCSVIVGVLLILYVFGTGCKSDGEKLVDATIPTIIIKERDLTRPFKLHVDRASLRYVRLETTPECLIENVNQIKILKNTVYILDKQKGDLFLFDLSGKFLKKLPFDGNPIVSFEICDSLIYVLARTNGWIYKLDLKGNLLKKYDLGFQGVQFIPLSDGSFVFNTAGLRTKNSNKNECQLIKVDTMGNLISKYLPIVKPYRDHPYYFKNQLSTGGDGYFASGFNDMFYQIRSDRVVPVFRFDLGRYRMPDSLINSLQKHGFSKGYDHITDLALLFQTNDLLFLAFTFKNEEGYLLLDRQTKKVKAIGVGSETNINADLNSVVPYGRYNGHFFNLVTPVTLLANKKKQLSFFKQYAGQAIKPTDNPIIMFYSLL